MKVPVRPGTPPINGVSPLIGASIDYLMQAHALIECIISIDHRDLPTINGEIIQQAFKGVASLIELAWVDVTNSARAEP